MSISQPQTARQPSAAASVRTWYGGYYLIDSIGLGGMAEVFRAVRPGAEGFLQTVALKRISPAYANSEAFVQMFCEEARISSMLSHPNIVQVHEFGKAEGTYFLAMEYLRGKDLLSVMRSTHARGLCNPPGVVALIGLKVASALAYVHELRGGDGQPLNLVHRDISPANIMLLKQGGVKVLDFGIAKSPTLARQQTQAGFVKGKFGYLSPEQARCEPLDGRSDIFSLGITLWEALTGHRLFRGGNDFETVKNILVQPIKAPSELAPGVPKRLDRIVMRALARDVADRYSTAREMMSELGEVLREHLATDEDLEKYMREIFGGHSSQVVPIVRDEFLARAVAEGSMSGANRGVAAMAQAVSTTARQPIHTPITTNDPAPQEALIPSPPRHSGRRGLMMAAAVAAVAVIASVQWIIPVLSQNEAPPVAQADQVTLELDSNPSGAEVMDSQGRSLGLTPLTLNRERSARPPLLSLQKPGYQTAKVAPTAEADAFLVVELLPATQR